MEKKNTEISETRVMQTLTDADEYDSGDFDSEEYDYEDDLDKTLSLDEQHDFLQARLIIATWNLVGDGMAKGEDSDYASADYVDCKKIARKLKCDYVKS